LPLAQWFDGLASGAGLGDDFKMWLGVNEQTVFCVLSASLRDEERAV
jgi:hypothetical protein